MDIAELRTAISRIAGVGLIAPAVQENRTGFSAIDALTGGIAGGKIAEIVGARSSGKMSLALAAAARATSAGRLVAWIDAAHELHPPSAAERGVELDRLLVVAPPPTAVAAARAAEIVARSNAFAL